MIELTQALVKSLLNYDPITGRLIHLVDRRPRGKAGEPAGWVNSRGYCRVSIEGVNLPANKIIWLWMTGTYPTEDVDHKDRNRANDVWSNLRLASRSKNLTNQGKKSNNTSGYKGVGSRGNSHAVRLRVNGKSTYFGSYPTAIEAAHAYDVEALKHNGEFAVTNKSLGLL
jgi:hypothetical protein